MPPTKPQVTAIIKIPSHIFPLPKTERKLAKPPQITFAMMPGKIESNEQNVKIKPNTMTGAKQLMIMVTQSDGSSFRVDFIWLGSLLGTWVKIQGQTLNL